METKYVRIEDVLKDVDDYYAHLKSDDAGKVIGKESLKAHTELTQKYFEKIYKEKQADKVMERFRKNYLSDLSYEAYEFFVEMAKNIVSFHDMGKINSLFQKNKMKNEKIKNIEFENIGSEHSLISAVIYFDYYNKKLDELYDGNEYTILSDFILYNSYIIAKHHSDLDSIKDYFKKYSYNEKNEKKEKISTIIEKLLKIQNHIFNNGFNLENCSAFNIVSDIKNSIEDSKRFNINQKIYLYTYERLLYSMLTAADYYATTEYMSGTEIKDFGNMKDIEELMYTYKETDIYKAIRKYEAKSYPMDREELLRKKDINVLRSELFLEAERNLKENINGDIFFLEAPTGSGKSNTAFNLSFNLLKDKAVGKIFYVYPFNTLVEQNMNTLKKIFKDNEKVFSNITVVNSSTPIEHKECSSDEDDTYYYQKALLDRQFMNYPIVVTTHVSIFDIMFGTRREAVFGFHQLCNSVIVLDEIQSYKNKIWGEIINFLKGFASLLNIKIIIMSATLPNLDYLTENKNSSIRLISNRDTYFLHACFKERVNISYELLNEKYCTNEQDKEILLNLLLAHIKKKLGQPEGKKILVEFLKKDSASCFYNTLSKDSDIKCDIEYMSGDDNIYERRRILDKIKNSKDKDIILVATQVIEAGIDIDMDIGYKDISKLDSEEQFMGRINRSCSSEKNGIVYFFNCDNPADIYKDDNIRTNKELTLIKENMKEILINKNFSGYYEKVLGYLKINNSRLNEEGLKSFFNKEAGALDFTMVKERMKLIDEDKWVYTVFLSRTINTEGTDDIGIIDGKKVWENYKNILEDNKMEYAKKRVELSKITSMLSNFVYQFNTKCRVSYNDRIGEIYYIEDGEKYFKDGKLDRIGLKDNFVDFI